MFNYSLLPGHMQDGMRLYIEQGIPGGGFMTAVLENDLMGAMGKADSTNRARLFDYGLFLYNEAPRACWGSPEAVEKWIEAGGLKGLEAKRKAECTG